MEELKKGMAHREVWDKVSEDYTIEINEEEKVYADEIYQFLLKEHIFPPAKLLELGSGSGQLSACLAQKGYRVTLLDFSKGALSKSKSTFEKYGLNGEFIEGDLFDLSTIAAEYDLVWNSGVMEHFNTENLKKIFLQISSIMKDRFLFLVPNPDSIAYLLMRYNLEGKGEWEYGQEYLRRNYIDIAKSVGLEGKILGYAASSISIWHFMSTFPDDKRNTIYETMVKDKLMPDNESYLVAYIVYKGKMETAEEEISKQMQEGIEPELYFAKSAESYHYKNEAKRLLEANMANENKLVDLEEKNSESYLYCEEIKKQNEELKKQKEDLEKQKEELENEIADINQERTALCGERDELKQQNEELKKQKEKVCGEMLPQIINSTSAIGNILNAKWFSKVIAIHAIMGALVAEPWINKFKIIVKIALRLVGKKYDLLIDKYRMNIQILQYLRNIDNIVHISKVNINAEVRNTCEQLYVKKIQEENGLENIFSDEPLVSVLMPVYNHVSYIEEAIRGVQCQTYTNWELIILNDGSTDGLLDVLKKYQDDPRIKIYTQDNQRLPNGLSNLHNLAAGDFVTWTSADNIMKEAMLESLVQKLIAEPNAVMVYADVAIIDDKGCFKTSGYREMNRDLQHPYIMRLPHCTDALDAEGDNFINACFMYRMGPVKALKGLYSADLEGLEDYDFWLRLRTFGDIVHLNNQDPLYYYRVHENTMSEDLLKNKLNEHTERCRKMLEYSQEKDRFAEESWKINFEKKDHSAQNFEYQLKRMNYSYNQSSLKEVYWIDSEKKDSNEHALTMGSENGYYHIYTKEGGIVEERARIYAGYDVTPLAKKVRQTFINGLFWEYPARFAGMQVLGCHLDLRKIDIEKTIAFIQHNPEILFSFTSLPGTRDKSIEDRLARSCENIIFMGEREYGNQLYLYASWDAMFVPPLINSNADLMPMIILAWNIGRWILLDSNSKVNALPLVAHYYYEEKLLGIKKVRELSQIENILNGYIDKYSHLGAVRRVIRYLNGIGQDIFVKRPDFALVHKERKFPPQLVENKSEVSKKLKQGYVGIMVDSLDKGGLEQVVALLAREFRNKGIEVRILCTLKGGEVARELLSERFSVEIFDGNLKEFETYICENRPILINTHFTKNMLEIVKKYNVPIIEVLHNMYVFQNETELKKEYYLSQFYTKIVAVSSIVKEIYEKKVIKGRDERIEVIGNAADIQKIHGQNRAYTRSVLGIPQDSLVFINVGSIDSRKNQLGLLKAFEIFNQTVDRESYLIIAGNVLSEFYDDEVCKYVGMLTCKEHVIKLPHHKNIGDLYNAADIFVMPSYYEGWSIAATEALYCGIPLIHSYCGSAKELLDGGENGILIGNPAGDIEKLDSEKLMAMMNGVNPANIEELVSAMTQVASNREGWRKKRGEISERSILNYSKNNMINKYIEVFEKVL